MCIAQGAGLSSPSGHVQWASTLEARQKPFFVPCCHKQAWTLGAGFT